MEPTEGVRGQSPAADLGWALYDGADEVAEGVRARLEVVGIDQREPGAHVYTAIAETDRLAARVLGRWLATRQEISEEEGQALSALGDLVGEVCLPGLVKAYLAFRDCAGDLIRREADRLGTPDEVRAEALWMMNLCTDGATVTMCRRFDDERTRLASELVAEQAKLQHLALHDPLTGLANRALFRQELDKALDTARSEGMHACVHFVDLDDFKQINDTYGHDAGDRVLVEVAARLSRLVRASDTVGRLGGDEFVVLTVASHGSDDEIARLAGRINTSIDRPLTLAGDAVRPRASVGVAHSDGSKNAEALLAEADAAMYEAKRESAARNPVRVGV